MDNSWHRILTMDDGQQQETQQDPAEDTLPPRKEP